MMAAYREVNYTGKATNDNKTRSITQSINSMRNQVIIGEHGGPANQQRARDECRQEHTDMMMCSSMLLSSCVCVCVCMCTHSRQLGDFVHNHAC